MFIPGPTPGGTMLKPPGVSNLLAHEQLARYSARPSVPKTNDVIILKDAPSDVEDVVDWLMGRCAWPFFSTFMLLMSYTGVR